MIDIAYLSAASALAGSAVGALTSGFATWISQRTQARMAQLARELARRDDLYRDFIIAASKAYGDALISNEPQIPDLIALYAMVSRMRVQSSRHTIDCAERVMVLTIETFFTPNKTMAEQHEMLKAGKLADPLKDFSEAARAEILALY
jgi:hypothetical protein